MGVSRFEHWRWNVCWRDEPENDYNATKHLLQYSAEDIEEAYNAGNDYHERTQKAWAKLEQENESLRNLLGANVRVMKAEIKKELEEKKKK